MAADIQFDGSSFVTGREDAAKLSKKFGRQVDIDDAPGRFILKVGVFAKIWAVTGSPSFKIHLLHQPTTHERIEAVVNRGQGDRRHECFCARKNLFDGRVVARLQEDTIDQFALWRRTQPIDGELFCCADSLFRIVHRDKVRNRNET